VLALVAPRATVVGVKGRVPAGSVMAVTVLLIEDYSTHRVLLHKVVNDMGCQALEAADGRAGLALAREHNPHLIVLDLVLPDIDGQEVLRRLRRDPATAHTPILIVSAVDREDRLVEALADGADDYVTKPYSPAVLEARMRVLLRAARLQRQMADDNLRAQASAQMARAAAVAADPPTAAVHVAAALRCDETVAIAAVYIRLDDFVHGPYGLSEGAPAPHRLADLLRDPGLAALCGGETPWLRRNGARLGAVGRGFEHTEALVLPLLQGDSLVGLVLAAGSGQPVTDAVSHRLRDLCEPAALTLSTVIERARRTESESRYRTLFEQAGDGVVILDPVSGECRQANHAMAAWLATMPTALAGRSFASLFDAASRPVVTQALLSASNGRSLSVGDLRLTASDGSTMPVEISLRRVRHATGADVIVVLHDLRGREAAGLYQQSSEDLGTLARTVRALNHAINNPLTCIIGLAQLLQMRLKEQPDQLAQLDTILSSAERVNDLSRQLREVAVRLGGDEPIEDLDGLLDEMTRIQRF